MTRRLLDRQSSLIHYLTSGAAIFEAAGDQAVDPALQGVDLRLLAIEARFSFEKRMAKIAGVFPRTLDLLGADRETLFREFAEAYPPCDIGRLENARQFHDFLSARWRREPAKPPYLPDIAACELAFATARVLAEDGPSNQDISPPRRPQPRVRRSPSVVLLRSAYDIRPWFENASEHPIAREVSLAIVARGSSDHPGIFELPPAVFDLLGSLDDWVEQDRFGGSEDASRLIADLSAAGLIEVGRCESAS